MFPLHTVLGSERRLVYLGAWRGGGDAAQVYGLYAESVGRAEHTAYVIHRPHVVEHHDKRQFLGLLEVLDRQAAHLYRS